MFNDNRNMELHGNHIAHITGNQFQAQTVVYYEDSQRRGQQSSLNGVNNPKPVFEDFLHYAAIQRRLEDEYLSPEAKHKQNTWTSRFSEHKGPNVNIDVRYADFRTVIEDSERVNALRALRTASWISTFYLITTDIIGPSNTPYEIGLVGWVPGILTYFFLYLVAAYCGFILWRLYVRLDSLKYPVKTYSDIAERIFGKAAGHVCTFLQSLQLMFNVGTTCLSNGQIMHQMINYPKT
ncbi:hypothetical protein H0H92_008664, partial [Tricholoma furcatifolium]